ncbi:TPA: hypothetical protein PXR36_004413 [Yersinia enterocolitica]|nr:hypothetical protein [Yersinia enterocolitica]
MENKKILKYLLYILSLWLLFLSLFIMSYDKNLFLNAFKDWHSLSIFELKPKNFVFILSFIFMLLGVFIYYYLCFSFMSGWSINCTVNSVSNQSHEHLEFLTTYVMPLVFTDVNSKRTMLNLVIMIIVIGLIYVKTNRFYSNPSLALLGFKIYKGTIRDRGDKEFVIVCHGELKNDSIIKYIKIDDETCIVKISS